MILKVLYKILSMDFTKLTLKSLKEKCKELGIKGYSNKKRRIN